MPAENNNKSYTRRKHQETARARPHTMPIASLALLDSLINEVSLVVSAFLAQRHTSRDCLAEPTSLQIRALANTRPYQTDAGVRSCLAFWDALDKVYN